MRIALVAPALLVVALNVAAGAADPQVFANVAKDTREAPYIASMAVAVTDTHLVLRFVGELQLGSRPDAVQRNTGAKFHHADNKLIVTLDNEALEALTLTVAAPPDAPPDAPPPPAGGGTGQGLAMFPPRAEFQVEEGGIVVRVPLELIQHSPVEVSADIHSLYYAAAEMVATEGRNLFATPAGPARIEIASLGVKPDLPAVTALKAVDVGAGSVSLQWQTSGRTAAEVTLEAPGHEPRTVRQALRRHQHKLTVTDLQADTAYTATVSGLDFARRRATSARVAFRTAPHATALGQADPWLRVQGKYIVDWAGKPFPLGGYSHFFGEYWYNEFPRYGTPALTARYFRSVGFNSCRLGLWHRQREHWAASITRQGDSFDRYGGPEGYVDKFLRPIVEQIVDQGVYAIIDWHWTYGMTPEEIELVGQFWEACAKAFKDEPRVAMYQLLNEPSFVDGQTRPDLAPRIREIVKDYITRIRKHDKRHIILVPDWNCGWGWATESQWAPVNFDPGDPYKQIVYSKHIAKEHVTDAFMKGGVDAVADKWDVPILFDEVEVGPLMPTKDHAWFYDFLSRNPRKYGFWIWVCGQYQQDLIRAASAFAQSYLPPAPFGGTGEPAIITWKRLASPEIEQADKLWQYRYSLDEPLPAGDYGLVVEGAPLGTTVDVAVVPSDESDRLIGTWLGTPEVTRWYGQRNAFVVATGTSAVDGAVYIHALRDFTKVVVRLDKELDPDWTQVQLFRLNPKHQVPAPTVASPFVE